VPANDRAIEPVRVAAGVEEAEPERVGEGELGELARGGGGQRRRIGLDGAAKPDIG